MRAQTRQRTRKGINLMSSTVAHVNELLEEDEGGLSGFTILSILTILVLVFMLVVVYAYRQGKASATVESEQLPVVTADPSPVAEDVPLAVAAEDGRQEVTDRINGTLDTRIVTAEDPSRDTLDSYPGAPARMAQRDEPVLDSRNPDPVVTAMNRPQTNTPAAETSASTRNVPAPTKKPAAQEQAAATQQQTASASTSSSSASPTSGTHVVQVGAFDSNKAAYDYFDGLASRMGSFVSAKRPDIQQATVNGRSYHRLRIGPFSSKSEANNYCGQLKSRGQDCLVRGV